MFGVTILGNNSALPVYDRHPTAQVVTLNDQLFLIDCGRRYTDTTKQVPGAQKQDQPYFYFAFAR